MHMKKTVLHIIRWLMTTTGFLLVLAAGILGVSFFISYLTGQWHWFQRSGALLVSIGAILSTRRLLRVGLTGMLSGSSYFDMARRLEMITGNAQDLKFGVICYLHTGGSGLSVWVRSSGHTVIWLHA